MKEQAGAGAGTAAMFGSRVWRKAGNGSVQERDQKRRRANESESVCLLWRPCWPLSKGGGEISISASFTATSMNNKCQE